ncbi:MAG TPA: ester cyclase [Chloroflexota bacterium]|nr:ester cyclase [Chloroflexota bacterium]
MTAQDNAELTRRAYQLFEQHRFDEVLASVADDVEVVPYYAPGLVFRGKDGFRDFMASHKNALPDIRVRIDHQVATDDAVVNECTATGTHTGPLVSPAGEIPPTGRSVTLHFCEIWTIRDGKVIGLHNYQDSGDLMRQLGLVPEMQIAGS